MEQLESHIWLTASSYMGKYLRLPGPLVTRSIGIKDLILCNRGEMYCTVQYCTSIMVKSMPRSLKFSLFIDAKPLIGLGGFLLPNSFALKIISQSRRLTVLPWIRFWWINSQFVCPYTNKKIMFFNPCATRVMILHTTNSSFIFNLYDKQSLVLLALHSIPSKFHLFFNSM
jgi:hypothetical protein